MVEPLVAPPEVIPPAISEEEEEAVQMLARDGFDISALL